MKLYKYSLIAALALSGALCACDDDVDYTTGAPVDGPEVYLPLTQDAEISIAQDATSVAVEVCRINTKEAITVPVTSTITNADGEDLSSIFTVPSEVYFAEGEKAAKLLVGVDFSQVEAEEPYYLTIALSGDDLTPYGASERKYVLSYSPWGEWEAIPGGVGTYTDSFFEPGDYEVPVFISHSTVDENREKYAVARADWFFYKGDERDGDDVENIDFEYTLDKTKTVEVDGVECPYVQMTPVVTNWTSSSYEGNYAFMDVRTWLVDFAQFATEENVDAIMERNNFGPSYFNPETGLFHIDVVWVMTSFEGTTRSFGNSYDYLQLPGYKNYQIDFQYSGNFVDPVKEVEYAIVEAYKSDDVASYTYDIFLGKLDEEGINAAIEDIKANDELEPVTASISHLTFVLEQAGAYTVVGVGVDETGAEVCTASHSFEYKTVQGGEVSPWNTVGNAEYTDGFICSLFNVPVLGMEVEIQEHKDYPGYYRMVDPYKDWADYIGAQYLEGKHYITFDVSNPEEAYIEACGTGVVLSPTYGEILVCSMGALAKAEYGTFEDGILTFPAGSLLVTCENLTSWYYANLDPDNPTEGDDFDRTWGEGSFYLDMSDVESASAPAHKISVKKAGRNNNFDIIAKPFESSFKLATPAKKLNSIDGKAIRKYREANVRQIKG